MIDIGGYKLYLNCRGEGSPTVVLDYGLGGVSSEWALVQPEIACFTHVCSYDRVYDGFSDAGPIPRTLHQQAFELHRLLEKAQIAPPLVLVGSSMGGLLDQVYKSVYPGEVGGIVFVDCTHIDIIMAGKRLSSHAKGTVIPPPQTLTGSSAPPYTVEARKMLDASLAQLAKEAEEQLQPPLNKIPPEAQLIWRWSTVTSEFRLISGTGKIGGRKRRKSCNMTVRARSTSTGRCLLSYWGPRATQSMPSVFANCTTWCKCLQTVCC